MGFLKRLFQADREREKKLQEDTIRMQAELWVSQQKRGESPDIYGDLKRIYGIEEMERKQEEKQQAKEIIKGAVTGGIIAGDAGAVVGAMVAKNKLDNARPQKTEPRNHNTSYEPQSIIAPAQPSYQSSRGSTTLANYETPEWYSARTELETENLFLNNSPFGDKEDDAETVSYCIAKLGVACSQDIAGLLESSRSVPSMVLSQLCDEGKLSSIKEKGRKYYTVEDDFWAYEVIKNHFPSSFRKAFQYRAGSWGVNLYTCERRYAKRDFDAEEAPLMLLEIFKKMKIMTAEDIAKCIQKPISDVKPYIADLLADGTISLLLYSGKTFYRFEELLYYRRKLTAINKSDYVDESVYENEMNTIKNNVRTAFSNELEVYTTALSYGVISQEEFDTKKKELTEVYNAD